MTSDEIRAEAGQRMYAYFEIPPWNAVLYAMCNHDMPCMRVFQDTILKCGIYVYSKMPP